jgi:hypothetical protein
MARGGPTSPGSAMSWWNCRGTAPQLENRVSDGGFAAALVVVGALREEGAAATTSGHTTIYGYRPWCPNLAIAWPKSWPLSSDRRTSYAASLASWAATAGRRLTRPRTPRASERTYRIGKLHVGTYRPNAASATLQWCIAVVLPAVRRRPDTHI